MEKLKTTAEEIFEHIVKDSFHTPLKLLGYSKKGYNFFLKGEVGKIINLQKSMYGSKDKISFTINIGLFSAAFWDDRYNYFDKPTPAFPTEPVCVIRKRIGALLTGHDIWYDIDNDSEVDKLRSLMYINLTEYILPFLERFENTDDILNELPINAYLERLILLFKTNQESRAKTLLVDAMEKVKSISERSLLVAKAKEFGLI